jgi:hypothetical protein
MVAWNKHIPEQHNPLARLHIKLARTAKALKVWAKIITSQYKVALVVCREAIGQLEAAQENQHLSDAERELVRKLKARIFGLAAIERSRARQRSRMTWLRLGDANTKFFHLMANSRKKKNFIYSLKTDNGIATSQQEKKQVIYNHYHQHTGTYVPRSYTLNFSELGWQSK